MIFASGLTLPAHGNEEKEILEKIDYGVQGHQTIPDQYRSLRDESRDPQACRAGHPDNAVTDHFHCPHCEENAERGNGKVDYHAQKSPGSRFEQLGDYIGLYVAFFVDTVGAAHEIEPEGGDHNDLLYTEKIGFEDVPEDDLEAHDQNHEKAAKDEKDLLQVEKEPPDKGVLDRFQKSQIRSLHKNAGRSIPPGARGVLFQ